MAYRFNYDPHLLLVRKIEQNTRLPPWMFVLMLLGSLLGIGASFLFFYVETKVGVIGWVFTGIVVGISFVFGWLSALDAREAAKELAVRLDEGKN